MTRVRQFSSLSRRFCESKLQMRNSKPYISVKPMILSTSQQNNRIKEEIIRTTVSKISDFRFQTKLGQLLTAKGKSSIHQSDEIAKIEQYSFEVENTLCLFLRSLQNLLEKQCDMRISWCVMPIGQIKQTICIKGIQALKE